MTSRRVLACVAFLFLVLPISISAGDKQRENPDLTAANRLFQSGHFADAAVMYQHALKADPNSIPAQAGLIRAYVRDDQVDAAFDLATSSLTAQPNSGLLLAAMGDVRYRRGEIPEAEVSFLNARKADPNLAQAYLGLARIYRTASFNRRAYDQVKRAHEIDPENPEVQRAWLATQPRRERLIALESYLAGPHPDDAETDEAMRRYLDYLKATVDKPVHACKLVGEIEKSETKLNSMYADAKRLYGFGLSVKINDRNQNLLLDTGASGILINRKAAEKAGLKRISAVQFSGIGDKGQRDAYLAVADHVRVGELDFKDCIVTVSEKPMALDEDGLIGADVFSSYVVDIDIPAGVLRLSLLPKRPDDSTVTASLASESDSDSDSEEQEDSLKTANAGQKADADKHTAVLREQRLPKDRYVAPEMAKWAGVYRIGHQLLIPTHVNDSKSMLFIIDTGAFGNMMSTRAARTVTKVNSDHAWKVKGLSGDVTQTFNADKATLQFANIRQPNQNVVTIDLSNLSKNVGVEVSGFLGFSTLRQLEMKIDYRDGLVEFLYDPNKLPAVYRH